MKEEERERLKDRFRMDQRGLELKREQLRSSGGEPSLHAEVKKRKGETRGAPTERDRGMTALVPCFRYR